MTEHLCASLLSQSPMPTVGWSGVKCLLLFRGVINHTFLFDSPMVESGFDGCRENFASNPDVCWRREKVMGLFIRVCSGPLISSERLWSCVTIP